MKNGMRINLLKNRRVLTEKEYIREQSFLQWSVLGLVITFVLTVAMAIWTFILTSKLSGIESEIASANKQMQGLSEANAEQVFIKNRLDLIGNFLDDQAIARESVQQVLALAIPGVTIGGMKFDQANKIEVVVSANTPGSLSDVLAYYKQKENYFPQVISNGVTRDKDGQYQISLTLSMPNKE